MTADLLAGTATPTAVQSLLPYIAIMGLALGFVAVSLYFRNPIAMLFASVILIGAFLMMLNDSALGTVAGKIFRPLTAILGLATLVMTFFVFANGTNGE